MTREILAKNDLPDYVPYAERRGFYERAPWSEYRKAFDQNWKPFPQDSKDRTAAFEGIAKYLSKRASE